MNPWLILIPFSLLCGIIITLIKSNISPFIAGLIPWLLFLIKLLIDEYILPYQGGGASMWPIALITGGTVAFLMGIIGSSIIKFFKNKST